MCQTNKKETSRNEYHSSQWKMHYDASNQYNHQLISRFSTIFTLITSWWSLFVVGIFTEPQKAPEVLESFGIIATGAATIAPILILLLYLYEMRMLLEYRIDRYSMFYYMFMLSRDDGSGEYKNIIQATEKSGATFATLIFMVITNAIAIVILSTGIFIRYLAPVDIQNAMNIQDGFLQVVYIVSIICTASYLVSALTTLLEYRKITRTFDEDLLYAAFVNDWKLPGIVDFKKKNKLRVKSIIRFYLLNVIVYFPQVIVELCFKIFKIQNKLGNAAEILLNKKNKREYEHFFKQFIGMYRRLSGNQKKAVYRAITDSWFASDCKEKLSPPVVFIDITSRCNLNCQQCYSRDFDNRHDINAGYISEFLSKAKYAGVKSVVFTGGEPLLYNDLFELMLRHRSYLFFFFTNATKLDAQCLEKIRKVGNVIPILSYDGPKSVMNALRGHGVYAAVNNAIGLLQKKRVGFGLSITVSADNIEKVQGSFNDEFCRKQAFTICFRINCINPTDKLIVSDSDYKEFINNTRGSMVPKSFGPIFHLPGDEAYLSTGGCVAGKYIVHIDVDGGLRSCPYARQSLQVCNTADEILEIMIAQKNNPDPNPGCMEHAKGCLYCNIMKENTWE